MSFDAAWTDGVLALTCAAAVASTVRDRDRWPTTVGLGAVGIAAAVGTFRFGGVAALAPVHDALSRVAGLAGLPLAALGVISRTIGPRAATLLRRAALPAAGVLAVAAPILGDGDVRPVRTVLTGGAMVAAAAFAARARDPYGVAAPIAVLVAGLGIAGDGAWLGLERDGWFHLAMAAAMACFALSARRPT